MPAMLARWALLSCLCFVGPYAVAEQAKPLLDCDDPLTSGPTAVKRVLGVLYHAETPAGELVAASDELQRLVTAATYCRVRVQSPSSGSNRRMAAEWVALHQWINRLADFVSLNATGEYRVDWKREYADFAQLYEFET